MSPFASPCFGLAVAWERGSEGRESKKLSVRASRARHQAPFHSIPNPPAQLPVQSQHTQTGNTLQENKERISELDALCVREKDLGGKESGAGARNSVECASTVAKLVVDDSIN